MPFDIALSYRFEDQGDPFITMNITGEPLTFPAIPNIGDTVAVAVAGNDISELSGRVIDRKYTYDVSAPAVTKVPTGALFNANQGTIRIGVVLAR